MEGPPEGEVVSGTVPDAATAAAAAAAAARRFGSALSASLQVTGFMAPLPLAESPSPQRI